MVGFASGLGGVEDRIGGFAHDLPACRRVHAGGVEGVGQLRARALHRTGGIVGADHDLPAADQAEQHLQRRRRHVHGVVIELLHVIGRQLLALLAELAVEAVALVGQEAAAVHQHQLELGVALEHAGQDELRGGDGGVDGAAVHVLEARRLLEHAGRRPVHERVQHHRDLQRLRGFPQRVVAALVQLALRQVGGDHAAVHAELLHAALELARGGLRVGEVQRGVREQAPPGARDRFDQRVVQLPHPDLAVGGRQLLAVDIEPRADQLLLHALAVEPGEAVGEVEHDAGGGPQRLAAGKGHDVTALVRGRDVHAAQAGTLHFLEKLPGHAVGVNVDAVAHGCSRCLNRDEPPAGQRRGVVARSS
jgi:hypothetical protein